MDIFPLFASNLVVIDLKEDLEKFSSEVIKTEFYTTFGAESKNSQSSIDVKILNRHPKIKKIILDNFKNYNKEILKLNCEFVISTSWVTKVVKNSYSQIHCHKNSFYSGVLYFGDYSSESSGKIEFNTPLLPFTDFLIIPEEFNIFNSLIWNLPPQKNRLIFFPSYLQHRITEHSDMNVRYSLAFNIVPKGKYGRADSFLDSNWN